METVSVTEARRRLGELVRLAERGEFVVLTRRGRKVARIAPLRQARGRRLPDLSEFRASIAVRGMPLSSTVIARRAQERY